MRVDYVVCRIRHGRVIQTSKLDFAIFALQSLRREIAA